jgi:hypothetical protein
MKLNNRNALIFIFSLVLTLSFIACGGKEETKPVEKTSSPINVPRETPIPGKIASEPAQSNTTPTNTTNSTTPTNSNPANGDLRLVDKKILSQLSTPPSGDKIKDAFSNESFKVNFYREGTEATWSRLKVDLNRNEKWDEKWDLANGQPVKRQVASKDDESYDQTFLWKNGKWEVQK